MVKIVDAKGKKCPLPIILTKRVIDQGAMGDVVEVLLDNDISKCNLAQYLSEIGLEYTEVCEGEIYSVKFELSEVKIAKGVEEINCPIPAQKSNNNVEPYVVVVKSSKMGEGAAELGEILMRSYLNSLSEGSTLPATIIFYNEGVELLREGCDCVEVLKQIESKEVEIICCGACVEYYGVAPSVGTISNMFKISSVLAAASKVIYP